MKKFAERFRQLTSGKSMAEIVNETKISEEHIYGLFEEEKIPSDKYMDGVKYAIYEILKELDICGSTEIRNSGDTDDGMCAATAEKIIAAFTGRTEEKKPAAAEAGQAHTGNYNTDNITQSKEIVKDFMDFLPILTEFARQNFGDIKVESITVSDFVNGITKTATIHFITDDYRYRITVEGVKEEQP